MIFMKPESALRRADELIHVGKKQRALETLFEFITSRSYRTWTKIHQSLMEKFLNLCVELKKSQLAKDGLYQYKTISQAVSVKSLEDTIIRFLKHAEEQCLNARQKAKTTLVNIDDLEVLQTPESLLLSAVNDDILISWLKFIWESYKQCLELLKNNNRVEKIYQKVVQMCFHFCQKYNRRTEFGKLCNTIRTHFIQSQKYCEQTYSVNFQLPETQALHLETRFLQLDTAIAMELWQEAFKAIEDIHILTTVSKITLKPQQLALFYNKVALVFWKTENHVFHAATILKLYVLHKEQKKNITHAELNHLSTKALLSILSIPLSKPRTHIDEHLINEKEQYLTNLLSLQQIPTRTNLINDMIKQDILNYIHPELKNMYEWLEIQFNPLKLSIKMEESTEFIEKLSQNEYSQYISTLRNVTVLRLLQQISQIYQTIELKRFINLAPSIDKYQLEKIIINAAKNNDIQVKIEDKLKALIFGRNLNLFNEQSIMNETKCKTNMIQKMPNEQIRHQLISISNALYTSMEILNENSYKERNDELKQHVAQNYHQDESIQRQDILKRREIIKHYLQNNEKKSQDEIGRVELNSQHQKDDLVKGNENCNKAEQQCISAKIEYEHERLKHRLNMQNAINKLRESDIGIKIIEQIGEENLYSYTIESLNSLYINAIKKHAREQKEKLKNQYKKVDFFIRAKHETEIPLIKKKSEEESQQRYNIQYIEYERAMKQRECFIRMENDKNNFLKLIQRQRHEEFKQRLEQLRKKYIEKKKQDKIQTKLKQESEIVQITSTINQHSNPHHQNKSDSLLLRHNPYGNNNNQPSHVHSKPNWNERKNYHQRASNNSWRTQSKNEQTPSSQQKSESVENWRTVERKHLHPQQNNNDRSGELSSNETWRQQSHLTDETRDNSRNSSNSSNNWRRSNDNRNWRTRERQYLNNWRLKNSGNGNEHSSSDKQE